MAAKVENAKREEQAQARIEAAAKKLAERHGINATGLTVTHKNDDAQRISRMEAMAEFLERVAGDGLPAYMQGDPNVPAQLPTGNEGEEPSASSEEGMAQAQAKADKQAQSDQPGNQQAGDQKATKDAQFVAAARTAAQADAARRADVQQGANQQRADGESVAAKRNALRPKQTGN